MTLLNDATYSKAISETATTNREDLVIVTFFADWCPSCASFWETLDEVARWAEIGHKVRVVRYEVDAVSSPGLARRLDITAVPTTLFYYYGIKTRETMGARPAFAICDDLASIF